MQRNEVQANGETAPLSTTIWAYVPCRYDISKEPETESSSLLSNFCCCFHVDDNFSHTDNASVHFTPENDPPVTLSQALLCLDNPQISSDLVSYPILEDLILAEHRSQNVLEQPSVIRSTQMLFMGYNVHSLQGKSIDNKLFLDKNKLGGSDSRESD